MPKGNPGVSKPKRRIPDIAKKFVESLKERFKDRVLEDVKKEESKDNGSAERK